MHEFQAAINTPVNTWFLALPPQVYLLERLATGDLVTGKLLLHAMVRFCCGSAWLLALCTTAQFAVIWNLD